MTNTQPLTYGIQKSWEHFHQDSEPDRCSLKPLLFRTVMCILSCVIRRKKVITGIKIGNSETKLSSFVYDTILCIWEPKYSPKVRQFGGFTGHHQKTNIISLLYTNNGETEKELIRSVPITLTIKT